MSDPVIDTEAIYAALFDKVTADPLWVTVSRRLTTWDKVDGQPALFQNQVREDEKTSPKMPSVLTLFVNFYVYCKINDDEAPTSTAINKAITAIRTALAPGPLDDGRQTLGGLVYHARVSGTVLIDEGPFDGQAIARVPCEITANIGV